MKIYSVILTDTFADKTFLLFKIKAAFINICNKGDGLRKVDMDGFIRGNVLIVWIRDFDRAVFYTGRTAGAFVFYNVSGLLDQGYLKPRI